MTTTIRTLSPPSGSIAATGVADLIEHPGLTAVRTAATMAGGIVVWALCLLMMV